MINPGMMMKLMNAKNTFESNHPKFAAFVSRFFMGGAITEGTIIEITITRPGEEPVSTNLNAVDDILSGRLAARDALATMMGRQLKQE